MHTLPARIPANRCLKPDFLIAAGQFPAACCVVVVGSIARVRHSRMHLAGPPNGFGRIRPSAEIQANSDGRPPIKTFGGDNLGKGHPRCF
jgi:hypothetical protein